MVKKQWIIATAATGALFVASLICLIASATLYARLSRPYPVFNTVIVRGAAEQRTQNYTPVSDRYVYPRSKNTLLAWIFKNLRTYENAGSYSNPSPLRADGGLRNTSLQSVYINRSRTTEATLPGVEALAHRHRFPDL